MTNKKETVTVAVDRLTEIVDGALGKIGVSGDDIETVRDVLLYAELRGNNQGLVKIPVRGVLPRDDAKPMEITHKMPCVAHINANGCVGMSVMKAAAIEAVNLATTYGVGVVGVRNLASSTGAIGYYANEMAKSGFVGIVMAGSPKAVAPAGGIEPLMGTNPLAIGIPTSHDPVVFDMATSSIAYFGLIQAQQRGEDIASGIAYDSEGKFTTDPAAALKGAITAFAGNKGSGLALMIEVLTGPLIGNALAGESDVLRNFGDLVIAINPAAFGERDEFVQRVDDLMAKVKASRLAEGCSEVLLPGERGNRQTNAVVRANEIVLNKALYDQIVILAEG